MNYELPCCCDRVQHWLRRAKDHDDSLYRHSMLVGTLAKHFAQRLGYAPVKVKQLHRSALLHDVGKLLIDSAVLQKSTRLSSDEMKLIHAHPHAGQKMLMDDWSHDEMILDVVRNHHERLDGSGYPDRLRGEAISEAVRIVSICDVYAAMTEGRSYGTTFSSEGAIKRMQKEKRTRLDMNLVARFEALINRSGICLRPDLLNVDS